MCIIDLRITSLAPFNWSLTYFVSINGQNRFRAALNADECQTKLRIERFTEQLLPVPEWN